VRTSLPITTRPLFAARIHYLLAALLLAGCASATVTPERVAAPVTVARPARIVVYDFAVTSAEVTLNQSVLAQTYRAVQANEGSPPPGKLATGHAVAKDLSNSLVPDLQRLGFTVEKLKRGTPVTGNALIVDGAFLNVEEGNRLRRLAIGLGAGASKLDTRVKVYQSSEGAPHRVLEFETHVESSKMPGAAITMGAGAAAQGAVTASSAAVAAGMAGAKAHLSSMGALTDETSAQITAYLSQYFAKQGWISSDKAQIPKFATPVNPSFPDS